jgi:N-acetyl-anhydromuramyl-L-alanine amidase AmpD
MKFVQAKHFSHAQRTAIDLIVIHTMEAHERNDTAENVAAYFAGPQAPQASAHYCIDADSEVQCVRDEEVAWHASEVNGRSIGLEHAGFAKQTPEEWQDDFSQAMLLRSAKLAAALCLKYDIPVCKLTPEQVKDGERGFCGHVDVNEGYGHPGHWDPGPSFPWDAYMMLVGDELSTLVAMASDSPSE